MEDLDRTVERLEREVLRLERATQAGLRRQEESVDVEELRGLVEDSRLFLLEVDSIALEAQQWGGASEVEAAGGSSSTGASAGAGAGGGQGGRAGGAGERAGGELSAPPVSPVSSAVAGEEMQRRLAVGVGAMEGGGRVGVETGAEGARRMLEAQDVEEEKEKEELGADAGDGDEDDGVGGLRGLLSTFPYDEEWDNAEVLAAIGQDVAGSILAAGEGELAEALSELLLGVPLAGRREAPNPPAVLSPCSLPSEVWSDPARTQSAPTSESSFSRAVQQPQAQRAAGGAGHDASSTRLPCLQNMAAALSYSDAEGGQGSRSDVAGVIASALLDLLPALLPMTRAVVALVATLLEAACLRYAPPFPPKATLIFPA